MILLIFIVAGLLIGLFRGGGLSGLVGIRLRAVWLVFFSAIAELAIVLLPIFVPWIFPEFLAAAQISRFLPLVVFALVNIRKWSVWVVGLGLVLNIAVISANGWRMPVSWLASRMPDMAEKVQRIADGTIPEYFVMQGDAAYSLWFLSDIIPCRIGVSGFASIGDIVLGLGLMLLIQHAMARYSAGRHVRGSLAHVGKRQSHDVASLARVDARAPSTQPVIRQEDKRLKAAEPNNKPSVLKNKPTSEQDPMPEQAAVKLRSGDTEFLPLSGPIPDVDTEKVIPIRLSPRLETIAGMVDRRAVVADVGCDHGKLSAWLALSGCPRVIAIDVSAKSLAKTRQLVREMGLLEIVQTRVGDGLKKLKPGEADVIVMAGLGGPTIADILAAGSAQARAAVRLVLQPMNAVGAVRRWLVDNGFMIIDEQLAEEDGRIYQILAAAPGQDSHPPMSLFDLEVGHLLISLRHPLLQNLLEYKLYTVDTILSEIADNATPKAEARRSELIELRGRCTEALEWLAQ